MSGTQAMMDHEGYLPLLFPALSALLNPKWTSVVKRCDPLLRLKDLK